MGPHPGSFGTAQCLRPRGGSSPAWCPGCFARRDRRDSGPRRAGRHPRRPPDRPCFATPCPARSTHPSAWRPPLERPSDAGGRPRPGLETSTLRPACTGIRSCPAPGQRRSGDAEYSRPGLFSSQYAAPKWYCASANFGIQTRGLLKACDGLIAAVQDRQQKAYFVLQTRRFGIRGGRLSIDSSAPTASPLAFSAAPRSSRSCTESAARDTAPSHRNRTRNRTCSIILDGWRSAIREPPYPLCARSEKCQRKLLLDSASRFA